MRDRSAVVIIENNKVALIKRSMENSVYYVFPGGGIEIGETPEDGATREAYEELGVKVELKGCIAKIAYNGMQYFFLAEIIGGTFGTGKGVEYTDTIRNTATHSPVWMDIKKLTAIEVIPKEVALKIEILFK